MLNAERTYTNREGKKSRASASGRARYDGTEKMNLPFTHFRACRAGRGTGPCALVTTVHTRMDTVLNCMCLKTLPEIKYSTVLY